MAGNKYLEKIAQAIELEKEALNVGAAMDGAKALAGRVASGVKANAGKLRGDFTNLRLATGASGKISVLKAMAKNPLTKATAGVVGAGAIGTAVAGRKKDNA